MSRLPDWSLHRRSVPTAEPSPPKQQKDCSPALNTHQSCIILTPAQAKMLKERVGSKRALKENIDGKSEVCSQTIPAMFFFGSLFLLFRFFTLS